MTADRIQCSKCKRYLLRSNFDKRYSGDDNNALQSTCKECARERARGSYRSTGARCTRYSIVATIIDDPSPWGFTAGYGFTRDELNSMLRTRAFSENTRLRLYFKISSNREPGDYQIADGNLIRIEEHD